MTTFEYDESGRLVRAITVREPEWLDDDRDWAEADDLERVGACEGCGMPLDETTDPANEGAYVAAEPVKCHGCAPVTRKRDTIEDPRDWVFRSHKVR